MRVNNPKRPRTHRKPATSTPTFHESLGHCPEDGIGGSRWHVTYRGVSIGHIYSTWDRRGVHFRVRTMDYDTVTEEGSTTPRAFEARHDAVNYLLDIAGIDQPEGLITYDREKGPRGGGEDRLDRRY